MIQCPTSSHGPCRRSRNRCLSRWFDWKAEHLHDLIHARLVPALHGGLQCLFLELQSVCHLPEIIHLLCEQHILSHHLAQVSLVQLTVRMKRFPKSIKTPFHLLTVTIVLSLWTFDIIPSATAAATATSLLELKDVLLDIDAVELHDLGLHGGVVVTDRPHLLQITHEAFKKLRVDFHTSCLREQLFAKTFELEFEFTCRGEGGKEEGRKGGCE
jgi:hypothetical protein